MPTRLDRPANRAHASVPSGCRRPIERPEVVYLEALGSRVRELRAAAGVTRAALADRAELTASTVERIERATRRTRRSTLHRIVTALVEPEQVTATVDELAALVGPALAPESAHAERVGRRRARRTVRARNRAEAAERAEWAAWQARRRAAERERERSLGVTLAALRRASPERSHALLDVLDGLLGLRRADGP